MLIFLCAVGAATLVGCGQAIVGDGAQMTPASVAVRYANALFSHHLRAAGATVLAGDQQAFNTLANVIARQYDSAHGVAAGSTRVSGSRAVVVLTGTFCSGPAQPKMTRASSPPSTVCMTNRDPSSGNAAVTVHLERVKGGRWYVYFPR